MTLYQCDICGGICLEYQIIFLTIQKNKDLFVIDVCPTCFQTKFGKVDLKKVEVIVEDGGDDEKSYRD
ncbi:TPA: hypothetical protein [Aquificae Joseph's Coat Spring virus]|nr:TPA: hypothetical protein [Aquificae Joseph's Coat Spring virus]